MADTIGELVLKITGDGSLLKKELSDIKNRAESAGVAGSKAGDKIQDGMRKPVKDSDSLIGKLKGIGTAFLAWQGVKKITEIGKALINANSQAQETQNKYTAVFRTVGIESEKTATRIAKAYNLSNEAAKSSLASIGDVLTGRGMDPKPALEMAAAVTAVSAELTSFQNYEGGAKGAAEALTKGLLNQHDALIGLGIVIQDKDIEKYAAGLGKTKDQLSATELAQANFKLILEQSKNAIGDTKNSQDSYAYSVRRAEAAQSDLAAALGKPFAAVATASLNAYAAALDNLTVVLQAYSVKTKEQQLQEISGDDRRIVIMRTEEALQKLRANTTNQTVDQLKRIAALEENLKILRQQDVETARKAAEDKNKLSEGEIKWRDAVSAKLRSFADSEYNKQVEVSALKIKIEKETQAGRLAVAQEYQSQLDKLQEDSINKKKDTDLQYANFALNSAQQLLSAIGGLQQAQYQQQIDNLENRKKAELEANGIITLSASQELQKQLDEAIKKGDVKAQNELNLKIKEAKINEKYEKEAAKLKAEQNHKAWEIQVLQSIASGAMAVLNAYTSTLAIPGIGAALAPAAAGAAGLFAGLQIGAVVAAEPPKFATGGIVPGSSYSGDNVAIRANSGEAVLTVEQQREFMDIANGQRPQTQPTPLIIQIDSGPIYKGFLIATQDGLALVDAKAVVNT